ncbi:MAG: pyridoxal-dependent decarboxylase, exosortase A system-associated [Elusimicrobia bacterium]|nr:pyridoxal-dependent decarboxylase, exosortase A system-associated [Elusimicrobiota bacterium]
MTRLGETPPLHPAFSLFPVVNGTLSVGGMSLSALSDRAGGTPFYVYDRAKMTERVKLLRRHFPSEIKLHYAVKANPMPDVVAHLAKWVDGADVASGGELTVAKNAGFSAAETSFAGPGKRPEELAQAVEWGALVNVESVREVDILTRLAEELGRSPRVAVRVNPDFGLKHSGVKMGGGPQPFGVDVEQVPLLLAEIGRRRLTFEGFHIFSGSQNLQSAAIVESQNLTLELAIRLSAWAPGPVRVLNIGGGFGIPYFPGDQPLDLAPIGENLRRWMTPLRAALPEAQITGEMGRYLVGEAGVYVCRILDRKVSRGKTFLVVDGGMHHHLAASGHFGQVIRKNFPVAIGNRMGEPATETVSIVGPLCTPMDLLADCIDLPLAQVGDFVVVFQSGAYGFTASPHRFLSHPPPSEILV